MDVIDRVRELGHHQHLESPVDDLVVARARRALNAEIQTNLTSQRKSRRRTFKLASVAAVAGAAALVAGIMLVPNQSPAAASEILRTASDAAAQDIPIQAGQYYKLESTLTRAVLWDDDMPRGSEFNNGSRKDAEAAFLVDQKTTYFIPEDRTKDWVVVKSAPQISSERFGDDASRAIEAWKSSPGNMAGGSTTLYPGGMSTDEKGDRYPVDPYANSYREMPHVPSELRNWYLSRGGDEEAQDAQLIELITEQLATSLPPANLRASMLNVLAEIPDIKVVGSHGDITTFSYVSGDRNTLFDINSETGLLTRTSTVWHAGDSVVPANIPDAATSTNVTVVDSAPGVQ